MLPFSRRPSAWGGRAVDGGCTNRVAIDKAVTVASVALFCTVTERDPPVPPPLAIRSLSPCTTVIFSAGMPVWSARNWANTVSCPCPLLCVPT